MSAPQHVSVNFGAAYTHIQFNYNDLDLRKVQPVLREYRDVLAQFTREELLFLRWRMIWKAMAREKQLPPKEFEDGILTIWGLRSGRGFGKTLSGSNWLGIEAAGYPSWFSMAMSSRPW